MEAKNDGSEFTCPDCKGSGINLNVPDESLIVEECEKCKGEGKLDWIEKAVGKKEDDLLKRINHHSIDPLGDIGCH